ncbi:unnamed protein product [Moneuplotes crassus]|uniref:Uncharacterized protein n=1 Tax=Euplotes crassus TaxID=5936 RepID=A0AAD1Y4P6_EUPCR|nr:unnamed protein product [Moneuplotes crassus]
MERVNSATHQSYSKSPHPKMVLLSLEVIAKIGAFFDKKLPRQDLHQYLNSIRQLEADTQHTIDEVIKESLSDDDSESSDGSSLPDSDHIDLDDETATEIKADLDEQEALLRQDSHKTRQELIQMRDGLILSLMQEFHPEKYSEVNALVETYTADKLKILSKNTSGASNSVQDSSVSDRKKLCFMRTNNAALIESIESEVPDLPMSIKAFASSKLSHEADETLHQILGLSSSSEQAQSFASEFSKFLKKCPKIPWRSSVIDIDPSEVVKVLVYFYLCQSPKSDADKQRIDFCFSGLVEWYADWAESQGEDPQAIIELADQTAEKFGGDSAKLEQLKHILFDDLSDNQRYYVIWNISVFTLGIVEDKHDIHYKVNQAALDFYMSNFLAQLYLMAKGKQMYLMLYKKISKIFYGSNKDMFSSDYYKEFMTKKPTNTVDYVSFIEHIVENPDFEKRYIQDAIKLIYMYQERFSKKDSNITAKLLKKIFKKSAGIIKDNDGIMARFECITPDATFSKHAVIALSGWMSESKSSHKREWKGLIEALELDSSFPIYSFSWASSTVWDMLKALLKPKWSTILKWLITKINKRLKIPAKILDVILKIRGQFIDSIKSGEATGKLLAHSLMSQFPFKDTSITLLAFSLGNQTIYSCLEELKAYDCDHIINNVYFLGGAVSVQDPTAWKHTLSVTNGINNNCYCTSDFILQLYRFSLLKYPIGLSPILVDSDRYEESKEDEEESPDGYRLINHDVTQEASGHTYYRRNMKKILGKIEFIG